MARMTIQAILVSTGVTWEEHLSWKLIGWVENLDYHVAGRMEAAAMN